jgi:UDP-N-acetylmuramate dehydrogenase
VKKDLLNHIETLLSTESIEYKTDYPLKNYSTYKLGGSGVLVIIPKTPLQLSSTIKILNSNGFNSTPVIGGGSNILISDTGYEIPVILLSSMLNYKVEQDTIVAQGGVLSADIAKIALEYNLSGAEFLTDLPGSIGGASYMNARAFGSEISMILRKATVVDRQGNLFDLKPDQSQFAYKFSPFRKSRLIVCEIHIQLSKGNHEEISLKMENCKETREKNGEKSYPSCGCVFKNPYDYGVSAGKLIDSAKLKGFGTNNVWVHKNHANFIVHNGKATSAEVRKVMEEVQSKIKSQNGVELQFEVEFEGNWNNWNHEN